jgi:deazaflavin-dependent oxidoreductase (nitroreductase family)
MSRAGRLTLTASQFLNERGIYLGRRSTRVHAALYRRTAGRLGGRLPGIPDARIALVDHVGRKSGRRRSAPLIFVTEGDAAVVAAAKAGQPSHPSWFHNLMAAPDTTLQIGPEVRHVHARLASGAERRRLWAKLVAVYPGFDPFQRNAGDRQIPVVVLDPRRP